MRAKPMFLASATIAFANRRPSPTPRHGGLTYRRFISHTVRKGPHAHPAGDGGTHAREQQQSQRWGVAPRKPTKLVVEALKAKIDPEPFLVLAEQRPNVHEIGRTRSGIDEGRFGASDDGRVGQLGRHSSSAMLTRRLWRPLFSILPILTRPISPVVRT